MGQHYSDNPWAGRYPRVVGKVALFAEACVAAKAGEDAARRFGKWSAEHRARYEAFTAALLAWKRSKGADV